ncbi:MAG: hypothetical protein WC728_18895, partial [Elusimicrobiota bacterium]
MHPFPTRRQSLWALAVLSGVGFIAFGTYLGRLGFYHDDYVLLEIMQGQAGILGRLKALAAAGFAVRPFALPEIVALHAFGGIQPAVYHHFLLFQSVASCFLFYVFLHRMIGEGLSLFSAALALALPVQSATHLWFSATMQTTALCLALASLLAHQVWLESRRARWLAGSMLLFALSLGVYEAFILMPLLLGAGLFFLRRDAGASAREAASSALRDIAPYGALMLAAFLWHRFGYEALSGYAASRRMGLRLP